MKLYETNKQIDDLLQALQPDPETGEMPENTDEIIAQLESLEAEKSDILRWLAESCLNIRANLAAIKAEEDRLYKLRKNQERVAERLIDILDRECGEPTDFGIAKLTYRKTVKADVVDPDQAIEFLQASGYDDILKYTAPAVDKTKVRLLIQKQGVDVPGVEIISGVSVSLK